MRIAYILTLLLLIALMMSISPYKTDSSKTTSYESFVWPTYKYGFKHVGFFNISILVGDTSFRTYDYQLLWKTKANLCIASSPAIADINKDGYLEAVYSSCDGYLYVVNASNGRILWKYITGGEFADPTIYDLDGDGYLEILTVGASGNLYCLNSNGSARWVVRDRMFSGSPVVGDVNGDGKPDIVMGSNDGYVYIISINGSVEAHVRVGDMPVSTPSLSDIDSDGVDEIVVVEGSYIHVIDYSNGKYVVHGLELGGYLVPPPVLYDVNGDGADDAVVVSKEGHVYIVDLVNSQILYSKQLNATDTLASPSIGDVNGDGKPDIVVATMEGLFILNMSLGVERCYPELQSYGSSPIISDINGDGLNEIILGLQQGDIVIVNAHSIGGFFREVLWDYTTGGPIMGSAAIADINNDGIPDFLIGSRDYYMYAFIGVGKVLKHTTTETTSTIATTITPTITTTMNSSISTIMKTTSTTTPTTIETLNTTTSSPATSTTTTTTSSPRTHTIRTIRMPTMTGTYKPNIRIDIVVIGVIAAIIVIALTYYYTRR